MAVFLSRLWQVPVTALLALFLFTKLSAALVPLGSETAEPPVFMCGPGDPEDLLYRPAPAQQDFIDSLVVNGGNTAYVQAVRTHGGDDPTGTHNPWVGNDPMLGLDAAVLDQWEAWFAQMDTAGVVTYLFIYDDAASPFGSGDTVPPMEVAFIEAIVNRFEHLDNLVWAICEECDEAFTPARIRNLASVVRGVDDNRHPIAVHLLEATPFSEYADDPNIDQFALQLTAAGPAGFNSAMKAARATAAGRYSVLMAEGHPDVFGAEARQRAWAVAMAGSGIMHLRWGSNAPLDPADLADCRILADFMRRTDYPLLAPAAPFGGADYTLAGPSFIVYGLSGVVGVAALPVGDYDLLWLDIATGALVRQQGVTFVGGDTLLDPPIGFGAEIAVWLTPGRLPGAAAPPPPPPPPPSGSHRIMVSLTSPTAGNGTPLAGQAFASGASLWIWAEPFDGAGVCATPADQNEWFLNGVFVNDSKNPVFDFRSAGAAWTIPAGSHVITATLPLCDGTTETLSAVVAGQ